MELGIVVLDEAVVRIHEIGSALRLCEGPVGHPALDVEGRLGVRLRRVAALYLVLGDAQSLLDGPGLPGPEHSPAVGDQGFGGAVRLHRRIQDG